MAMVRNPLGDGPCSTAPEPGLNNEPWHGQTMIFSDEE
jgi:hypothetical protein